MGDQVEKIMDIPVGRGSNAKPSGTENPVGWGVKLEKTLLGGYGYFLEPHMAWSYDLQYEQQTSYLLFIYTYAHLCCSLDNRLNNLCVKPSQSGVSTKSSNHVER